MRGNLYFFYIGINFDVYLFSYWFIILGVGVLIVC